jgi:Glyoxalase-like domain
VLFQLVPEAKAGKNRVHLDLRVGDEHREAEVARLVGRGARELHRGSQGPHEWATMADPEGNEFCVA